MAVNGTYIVQGEMTQVVMSLRRSRRYPLAPGPQMDEEDPLLRNFTDLRDVLNTINDLADMAPSVFLSPFLEVIRSEHTSGPVTGLALSAIAKFLSYGLIDPSAITAASAVEQIADAVTHARFVGTDPGSDEVVLLKILQVLRTLLLTPVGSLLTNESVCEVLQSCFRICFETRLSELLRRACEYTLMDMIQLLFTRLPTFQEDPRDPYVRKLIMRARTQVHAGHTKRRKQYKHRKKQQVQLNVLSEPTTPDRQMDTISLVPPASTPDQERQIPTPEPIEDRVESRESLADVPNNKTEDSASQSNVVDVHGNHLVACDPDSNPNSDTEGTELQHSASVASQLSQPSEDAVQKPETPVEEGEPEPSVGEEADEIAPQREQDEDDSPQLGRRRLVNQRGVTFTPDERSANGPLVPYGLPCIRELFRFLISLIDPYDRQNSDQMIQMGLNLLTVALEAGADYMGNYSLLMPFVKNELCRNFLRLLSTDKMGIFAATLRACFLLFEALRTHMKLQLEQYLQKLMQIVDSENPKIQFEQRETALEALVQLWRIPGLVTELYLNYDCDLYCSNLFEDVTKLLSKNSFPVAGIYSTHLLSLDALLTVVDTIEANCQYRMIHDKNSQRSAEFGGDSNATGRNDSHSLPPASGYTVGRRLLGGQSSQLQMDHQFVGFVPHLRQNRMPVSENLPGFEELIAKKSRKRLLATGTDLFNQSASKGIQFLQEHKLLHEPSNADEIVAWIRENPRLDKRMIGDFISNRKNSVILDAFVRSFNFKDTRLDDALRLFLESFRLPGEAPLVSMIMEHFADHWHKANDEPFADTDAAFTLSYAIIMLNTDQHNPMARRQNKPMAPEDFKRNLKGCNRGDDFDPEMLEDIYWSIHKEEIVMPEEHGGVLRENYLWKVMLLRSGTGTGNKPDGQNFTHAPSGLYDHSLFSLIWGSTVAAISFVFDKTVDDSLIQKLLTGFRKCAAIAAHYSMCDVFDNLIISLCKFSTIMNYVDSVDQLAIGFGESQKAQLSAKAMFELL